MLKLMLSWSERFANLHGWLKIQGPWRLSGPADRAAVSGSSRVRGFAAQPNRFAFLVRWDLINHQSLVCLESGVVVGVGSSLRHGSLVGQG
jgi:hypothetical protein